MGCLRGSLLRSPSVFAGRVSSLAPLEAESCRSHALYLFVNRLNLLVELRDLRAFLRIGAAQLIKHFADGEFSYFSHRKLLCAGKVLLAATSNYFNIAQLDIAQERFLFRAARRLQCPLVVTKQGRKLRVATSAHGRHPPFGKFQVESEDSACHLYRHASTISHDRVETHLMSGARISFQAADGAERAAECWQGGLRWSIRLICWSRCSHATSHYVPRFCCPTF